MLRERSDKYTLIPVQREGDAGFDLSITSNVFLEPGERKAVLTRLSFRIPKGYCGIINVLNSLALEGLDVGGGVIGSGYVGEVEFILKNTDSVREIWLDKGKTVAQIFFVTVLTTPLIEVDDK